MQPHLDPIAQTGEIARRNLPEGARRHGPGGMEAAGLEGLQNTGRDRLREAIIIGTYGQVAGEHAQIHGNGRTHYPDRGWRQGGKGGRTCRNPLLAIPIGKARIPSAGNETDMSITGATPSVNPELSIVVPVFNEADNLEALIARLTPVLERIVSSHEILFVDDGSSDETMHILRKIHNGDRRCRAVSFSRNFGKEIAIAAGLDHARGRAIVIIDADLQHPPETIEAFVAKWREGYKNVYGARIDRNADSPLRRMLTKRFYMIFEQFGETGLPDGAGDFRLLDRQAVEALKSMPERARFSKGLYAWIGFKSIGVPFEVAERHAGSSKFSYRKLTRFALDGLMSFSTLPLKVWTYVGMIVSAFSLLAALYYIMQTIIRGIDVPGYASLIVSIMFFAGVQLLTLGIMGEYIGRIFAEVKRRPLYLVAERLEDETTILPQDPTRPGARTHV